MKKRFNNGVKKGTILECINFDDPADVRAQGFRYYVAHSGYIWSVPESSLSRPKIAVLSS